MKLRGVRVPPEQAGSESCNQSVCNFYNPTDYKKVCSSESIEEETPTLNEETIS